MLLNILILYIYIILIKKIKISNSKKNNLFCENFQPLQNVISTIYTLKKLIRYNNLSYSDFTILSKFTILLNYIIFLTFYVIFGYSFI